jgi:hypothetical protein
MRDYPKCNCALQAILNQEKPISIVDYEKRTTENSKVSSVYVVYTLKVTTSDIVAIGPFFLSFFV